MFKDRELWNMFKLLNVTFRLFRFPPGHSPEEGELQLPFPGIT